MILKCSRHINKIYCTLFQCHNCCRNYLYILKQKQLFSSVFSPSIIVPYLGLQVVTFNRAFLDIRIPWSSYLDIRLPQSSYLDIRIPWSSYLDLQILWSSFKLSRTLCYFQVCYDGTIADDVELPTILFHTTSL